MRLGSAGARQYHGSRQAWGRWAKAISDVLCSAQRARPGSEEGGLLLNCLSLEFKIPLVFIPVRTDVAPSPCPRPLCLGKDWLLCPVSTPEQTGIRVRREFGS